MYQVPNIFPLSSTSYILERIAGKICIHYSEAIACVASVSVGFESKERPRNGVFGISPARKMGREPKKRTVGVGEGKEGTACGQTPGF